MYNNLNNKFKHKINWNRQYNKLINYNNYKLMIYMINFIL